MKKHRSPSITLSPKEEKTLEKFYVKAENGLIIREKPESNSKRLGKFDYGDEVAVLEKTDIFFSITENEEVVSGHWLKVKGLEKEQIVGYVFDGFLTNKRVEIKFKDLTVEFDDIELMDYMDDSIKINNNIALTVLDLSSDFENKYLRIKHERYKKLKFFNAMKTA